MFLCTFVFVIDWVFIPTLRLLHHHTCCCFCLRSVDDPTEVQKLQWNTNKQPCSRVFSLKVFFFFFPWKWVIFPALQINSALPAAQQRRGLTLLQRASPAAPCAGAASSVMHPATVFLFIWLLWSFLRFIYSGLSRSCLFLPSTLMFLASSTLLPPGSLALLPRLPATERLRAGTRRMHRLSIRPTFNPILLLRELQHRNNDIHKLHFSFASCPPHSYYPAFSAGDEGFLPLRGCKTFEKVAILQLVLL